MLDRGLSSSRHGDDDRQNGGGRYGDRDRYSGGGSRYNGGGDRGGDRRGGYKRLPQNRDRDSNKRGKCKSHVELSSQFFVLFLLSLYFSASRMIPLPLPEIPSKLQELQELTLRLGDFTSLGDEDYIEYTKALAEVAIAKGKVLYMSNASSLTFAFL